MHNLLGKVLSLIAFTFLCFGNFLIAQEAKDEKEDVRLYDFGVVDLNGEKQLSITLQAKELKANTMIYGYESSCECLQLLTELPIVSDGEGSVVIRFSYKPFQIGYVNVDVAFFFSESSSEKIPLHISGVVFDKKDLVDAKNLLTGKGEKYILVDLRNEQDYEKCHAMGSLHMDALALQSKIQWKDYPLILLGYSLSDDALLAVAAELRSFGFNNVKVLQGGINGWIYAGGSINGSAYHANQAAIISCFNVYAALNADDWIPVLIGNFSSSEKEGFGREIVQIKSDLKEANAKNDLLKNLRQVPSAKRMLFISEDGDDYAHIELLIPDEMKSKITFLRGGMNAWKKQRELSNEVTLFPTAITLQSANGGVTRAGPCGGCGKK